MAVTNCRQNTTATRRDTVRQMSVLSHLSRPPCGSRATRGSFNRNPCHTAHTGTSPSCINTYEVCRTQPHDANMQTHRPVAPGEILSFADLAAAKFKTEISTGDPEPRHDIHGEWYCTNEHCAVREVRIVAKWTDGDRPKMPRFVCPNCSLDLKFHGHLKTVVMVPAENLRHDPTPARFAAAPINRPLNPNT